MQFGFGTGLFAARRTDIANPTPAILGVLQEADFNFDRSLKELFGQSTFPVAVAGSTTKITGTAKVGQVKTLNMNASFFGSTVTAGQILVPTLPGESVVVPATPYQVTVAQSATFIEDLGVFKQSDGTQFTRVASGPTTGQYSVNEATGVYTFAAADTTFAMYILYSYSVATPGNKFTITNPLMGAVPTWEMYFQESFQSKNFTLRLLQCVSGKLTFPFKNQDFMIHNVDFEAFADPTTGNVGYISASE